MVVLDRHGRPANCDENIRRTGDDEHPALRFGFLSRLERDAQLGTLIVTKSGDRYIPAERSTTGGAVRVDKDRRPKKQRKRERRAEREARQAQKAAAETTASETTTNEEAGHGKAG